MDASFGSRILTLLKSYKASYNLSTYVGLILAISTWMHHLTEDH
jgi:hypothetical protein